MKFTSILRPFKTSFNLSNYKETYGCFSWTTSKSINEQSVENNIAFKILDKNLDSFKNKTALIWINESEEKKFSFYEIFSLSSKFGNLLKNAGIIRGDRVFFFLPRVPAIYYGFLGALRIGAIPGTLFPAFGTTAPSPPPNAFVRRHWFTSSCTSQPIAFHWLM